MELPIDRFAERSDLSRKLVWDDVKDGLFLRGLIHKLSSEDPANPPGKPILSLVKIITRAATDEEIQHFQHPRMPLIGAPLFGSATDAMMNQIFTTLSAQDSSQAELF